MKKTRSFIARLKVKPERRGDFVELQTELKHLVHKYEPDALVYEVFESEDDANLFHCIATFRDMDAYEVHMSIDFHHRLVPPILDCLAEDMQLSFHTSHGY